MMNPIQRLFPDLKPSVLLLASPVLLCGLTFSSGCSEEPPPPPPAPPVVVKKEKPKSRSVAELIAELGIDSRIHMDEDMAHRNEAVRAAGLLFAHAMLLDDHALAKQLSGTDVSVNGMMSNPGFAQAQSQVERIDLEFGRIFGEDAMLVVWEFPEQLAVQMWAIGGPVSESEATYFWPGYTNEFTKAGEADVSATDYWSWTDGLQVAMFAAPGLPNMIDNLGEKPFEDWSAMVASWHETALQPDLIIAVLGSKTANSELDAPTGGSGRPRSPGGGLTPGLKPK